MGSSRLYLGRNKYISCELRAGITYTLEVSMVDNTSGSFYIGISYSY